MNPDFSSLESLQPAVAAALKQWHEPDTGDSPLESLHLYRQAQLAGLANPRHITNKLLLNALDAFAHEHPAEADLLRKRFLDDMTVYAVANVLNIGEATLYRRQNEAIRHLAELMLALEMAAKSTYQANLEQRFKLPPATDLIGVATHQADLLNLLTSAGPPWLISIEGLGGLGKTALANALFRESQLMAHYQTLLWVSAKQEEFFGLLTDDARPPALPAAALIDQLLRSLQPDLPLPASLADRERLLIRLLKQTPTLVVIDNLETVTDYEALLPLLRQAANPGKFLLTSRHSLQLQPDVFCRSLPELSRDLAHQFIRREAACRGQNQLAAASDSDLDSIYQVVGGNPLALKLIIGQTSRLSLPQVLANLQQAQGDSVDKFYTYIYWQSWHLLAEPSRQLLLMMPLAPSHGGSLDHMAAVSGLADGPLNQAIDQLVALSLLDVGGSLTARRYRIHRLTESFLLTEVTKWQ